MKPWLRWLVLLSLAVLALQIFFVLRIALMAAIDPQSTAFERSEAVRVMRDKGFLRWREQWVPYAQISDHLKQAVIASEDGDFVNHDGVQWDAVKKAWEKNTKAETQAKRLTTSAGTDAKGKARTAKVVGGSTITQQLAKNLLLSGERNLFRKSQELLLTLVLEHLLDKERILEIYLNHVEWAEGVFGAEAAAQHYFRKSAAQLGPMEAARLAVMLPRPKYFESLPKSAYLAERSGVIAARMGDAQLP